MNLETALPPNLWDAVRINYEKRDFTAAILDCCYFISEILREKSGSDGDGVPLVGQALGGSSPKIRIAKDQSETEQNAQKGIESILRGFYQAIRNPRSHKKIVDNAEDGVSIILFCGYLVRQLEQAKTLASKEDLIRRALDKDFVPNDEYADLFLSEIPNRLRLEVFFGVYQMRAEWQVNSIVYFNKHLLLQLSSSDRSAVVDAISEDLKTADDEKIIRNVVSGIPPNVWKELAQIARLRIENKIIGSIRDGKFDAKTQRCLAGALATWGRSQFSNFSLKRELVLAVAAKLESHDSQQRDYAVRLHLHSLLANLEGSDLQPIYTVIARKLRLGYEYFHSELLFASQEKWSSTLKEAFANFIAKTETTLDDEIPF